MREAIAPMASHFEKAPLFHKIALVRERDIAPVFNEVEIRTVVNGLLETTHVAKRGDLIITGALGELFVSSQKSFDRLHIRDPLHPHLFHPLHRVRALLLEEDAVLQASWGAKQSVRAGGVIVLRLNDNRIYGNQASTFEATYFRVSEESEIICGLSIPLENQLAAARQFHAVRHELDIIQRIIYRDRQILVPRGTAHLNLSKRNDDLKL